MLTILVSITVGGVLGFFIGLIYAGDYEDDDEDELL